MHRAFSLPIIAYGESRDLSEAALGNDKDKKYLSIISDLEKRVSEAKSLCEKAVRLADSQSAELKDLRERCIKHEQDRSYIEGRANTLQSELDRA